MKTKVIISMEEDLRYALKVMAAKLRITLTELINITLQERINKEDK